MKKFLPYLVVIALLGASIGWFIAAKNTGSKDKEESAFAIDNPKDVTKVILTDSEKHKVELTNNSGIWMLGGKYPAREELVQSVFEVFTRITPLCPVPRAAHDNVLREMMAKNVKVELYTKDGKNLRTFYVGGPTVDGDGTYMLLENDGKMAARPYIMYIPGLHGYVTTRFSTDEETWRSKVLYNYKPEEIAALSVEYPADEKNSFFIKRAGADSFTVSPKDEKFAIHQAYEQKYIRQYLDFYSSVSIEAFDNSYSKKDSMMQTVPYCVIRITETDSAVNTVKLFYMPVSKRSKMQFDAKGNDMTYDIDHYHAAIHDNKDWAIVQYYVFGKLLRNYKDFFFKPASK